MPKLKVYSLDGKELRDIALAEEVFGIEPHKQAMFDVVVMQRASMRQGTHSTKTRSEVAGGGRKPFRQKGTGRARQGSIREVQMRGGGIAFGPKPRNYGYKLNRKVRRLALRSVLSLKVVEDAFKVIENLSLESTKTKEFVKVMSNLQLGRKTLFVASATEEWDNAYLAMRNIPDAMFLTVEELNVYDLMNADKLVMTEEAAKLAGEVFA
ncbi:MAG: 50S ribosomal protein L4 [Erysipelotrichaceae bacterium]|nr:50S ribosomal protein L4 [Erysipelotrichaceae bacterium]MDD3924149.1 50S ribosomal protein L4 [Erysipelotrichaceae bacterium]MDD4641954.1 50S ribosomal protein L4 [Erysipelotrichaceae bacterium]